MWSISNKLQSCFVLWEVMPFYAVHIGRNPGIFNTWKDCEKQVKSFSGAKYKKFSTLNDAKSFVSLGYQNIKQTILDDTRLVSSVSKYTNSQKRKACGSNFENKIAKLEDPISKDTYEESWPIVFTDGACSQNGKRESCAGYGVWWGDNHSLNLSCKLNGIQTNQRAEIAAIAAAIKQARENDYKKIFIKTDSMFVINCLTKWAPGWKRNNWLKSDGKPVVHKKEFLEILSDMEKVKVKFDHVPGHRGIHGNEMADQLAVAGAKL